MSILTPLPFVVPYVRYAQPVPWPRGYRWGPRRIYDHEIVYVATGTLFMQVGDDEFTAPADHVFLIQPRVLHRFQAGKDEDSCIHFGIHFDWLPQDSGDFSYFSRVRVRETESLYREPRAIPGWDNAATPLLDLRGRPRVRALLHEVMDAYAGGGSYHVWQAGALLAAVIAQLSHEAHLLHDLRATPHVGADAIRRVQHARELLEARRVRPLAVGEVAEQVGWTADHLGRMCREVLGISPYRIQTLARLRLAKEMLRRKDASIAVVARQCGFKDVSYFMSTFKRETGITARQFMRLGETKGEV